MLLRLAHQFEFLATLKRRGSSAQRRVTCSWQRPAIQIDAVYRPPVKRSAGKSLLFAALDQVSQYASTLPNARTVVPANGTLRVSGVLAVGVGFGSNRRLRRFWEAGATARFWRREPFPRLACNGRTMRLAASWQDVEATTKREARQAAAPPRIYAQKTRTGSAPCSRPSSRRSRSCGSRPRAGSASASRPPGSPRRTR